MSLWYFHSCVPPARQAHLAGCQSFEDIAHSFALAADVLSFIWEPFDNSWLRGSRRASFRLKVPEHLYDLYFNSPVGYRSQYARSPSAGDQANRYLIECLSTLLVARASDESDAALVSTSLRGVAAKTWIDESEVATHLLVDEPEIDYPRWATDPDYTVGLRAPIGTRIVVYGGWLDSSGAEVLNSMKSNRSQEIHERGFS